MKQITEIADARLVKGLAHPLRIDILRVLAEGVASPSEISERIGAPLGNVSYHVRFLARVGLIELCETQPRRGAVEHYYRAVSGVRMSDGAWAAMPGPVRDTLLSSTLDEVGRSVGAAAAAGGFSHGQARASRIEMTLDCTGFAALSAAVAELHDRAVDIERESARRMASAAGDVRPGSAIGGGRDGGREAKATINADGSAPGELDPAAALRAQLVLMLYDAGTTPQG